MNDKLTAFYEEYKSDFFDLFDKEYFEFCQKMGSERKTDTISIRVSKRFKWALDVFKRYSENEEISDGTAVEDCVWQSIIKENRFAPPTRRTEKRELVTKYFLAPPAFVADESQEFNISYMSVVEFTWSQFYIFRILKMNIICPELLKEGEKRLIKFINKEKSFWWNDEIDIESGYYRPLTLSKSFTDSTDGKDYDSFTEQLVNLMNEEEIGSSILQKINDARESYIYRMDDDIIKAILNQDRFDVDYINRSPAMLNNSNLMDDLTRQHFPLEIKRLRSLRKKAKSEAEMENIRVELTET